MSNLNVFYRAKCNIVFPVNSKYSFLIGGVFNSNLITLNYDIYDDKCDIL